MNEEMIDKIFSILIKEELGDKEFWEWVASWKDGDDICSEAENWDIKIKKEELKKYPKLVEKIKKQLVIDEL